MNCSIIGVTPPVAGAGVVVSWASVSVGMCMFMPER
jgi:hypothetical protein